MPIPFALLEDNGALIIQIESITEPILHYSTRPLNIKDNSGSFITVFPFISDYVTIGYAAQLPLEVGTLPQQKENSGFTLIYDTSILYEVAKYYGSKVRFYVGSISNTELNQFTLFYTGYISNVKLGTKGVNVTLSSKNLSFNRQLLRTFRGYDVPVVVGSGDNFGGVPIEYAGSTYYVVSGVPVNITQVKDNKGNGKTFNTSVIEGATILEVTETIDSSPIITCSNATGTIADLLQFLLHHYGFSVNTSDIANINAIYNEQIGIQLFTQMTLEKLLNLLLHSLNLVWYIDFLTEEVRIKEFKATTSNITLDDTSILSTNLNFIYLSRPYTYFKVNYDFNWAIGDNETLERVNPVNYPEHLKSRYKTINVPMSLNAATIALDKVYNSYKGGLGVATIEISVTAGYFSVGDTIRIESNLFGINSDFFVQSMAYSFKTHSTIATIITI